MSEIRTSYTQVAPVAPGDGADATLAGLACPFNKWSHTLNGGFKERFLPNAFSWDDVVCCVEHDEGKLLGRTKSGTLALDQRADGLHVSCTPPDAEFARTLRTQIRRGDVDGMSFRFEAVDEEVGREDGMLTRTVLKARLYEVCFTHRAAYPQTSASARTATGALSPASLKQTLALLKLVAER